MHIKINKTLMRLTKMSSGEWAVKTAKIVVYVDLAFHKCLNVVHFVDDNDNPHDCVASNHQSHTATCPALVRWEGCSSIKTDGANGSQGCQ